MTYLKSWDELEGRFKHPDNWQSDWMKNRRGRQISCAQALPENQIEGHVLVAEGLGEYKQKYIELARDFNRHSWGFHIFDRQGQGLSGRNTEHPYKIHCDDYRDDVDDIIQYAMTKIPKDGKPIVLLGHSTGGLLTLPVLHADSLKPKTQRLFKAAVLSDPLLGFLESAARHREGLLAFLPMPRSVRRMTVPGGLSDWVARYDPRSLHKVEEFSTDPQRSLIHDFWQVHKPELRTASCTMGWIQEMSRAMTLIRNPGYIEGIEHLIAVCTSVMKLHVDPQRTMQAISRMRNAIHLDFPEGRHELLMEKDPIRDRIIKETIKLGLGN